MTQQISIASQGDSSLESSSSPESLTSWSSWSKCFGRCSVKFQTRNNCSKGCVGDQNMEIRECLSHTKCTAHRIRLSHIPSYAAKLKLEVHDGKKWTSVCHPVGIADNLCQIQGFESAENEKKCDMIQTHSYGNKTCGVLQRIISINCSDTHEVTTVCKVNVSLKGNYSGKVKFFHKGILKSLSGIGWNMIAAQLVCRQIGFKRAVAPFSTKISRRIVSKECVDHIHCSGSETSLSYCKFNFTTNYKCNPDAEASVTCDPERDLDFKFRLVNITQFGETIQVECNLNASYGNPLWYSLNGQIIGSEKNLRLENLTTTQAGVYFCKNNQQYGAVVVYVAAKSVMKQMTIPEKKYTILACNVSGVPQPMVLPLWRLNGQLLRKATVTINNGLNITDEVRSGEGRNYSCGLPETTIKNTSTEHKKTSERALRNVERQENFTLQSDTDTRYLSVTASRWEISPKQIHLQSILGTGAFGEVWKAVVYEIQGHPEETTVAVKKLKRN
ncbi:uncharacterized protein LOC111335603 [Stylophora pistillata]|uniref:uncharacterized protein LOC111335603 n=1 Tax=Stylophora pistillata TaxID=50429 RepID=UPI000C04CE17|nr:uncharacterized protein LOC111335603 [Stylophora pistillata]